MSIIDYIEDKVLEANMAFKDLKEIYLDRDMYNKLINEIAYTPMYRNIKNGIFSPKKLTINTYSGPIDIKVRPVVRMDPNDILKEIL